MNCNETNDTCTRVVSVLARNGRVGRRNRSGAAAARRNPTRPRIWTQSRTKSRNQEREQTRLEFCRRTREMMEVFNCRKTARAGAPPHFCRFVGLEHSSNTMSALASSMTMHSREKNPTQTFLYGSGNASTCAARSAQAARAESAQKKLNEPRDLTFAPRNRGWR